jgi:hypothetical protein
VRSVDEIRRAQALVEAGWPLLTVSEELGISRAAIRDWRDQGFDAVVAKRVRRGWSTSGADHGLDVGVAGSHSCDAIERARNDPQAYAYLFGQYLGDGTIDRCRGHVYKIRFFSDAKYPGIVGRIVATGRAVLPGKVTGHRLKRHNYVIVTSHWKHMRCLFPQHGPGRKHERLIVLDDWQNEIVLAHPRRFLRGLIESDGCRVINRVNGGEYPRYMFSNRSVDIMRLFIRTVEQLGVHWTTANKWSVAISRRPDVDHLDTFIGPKW